MRDSFIFYKSFMDSIEKIPQTKYKYLLLESIIKVGLFSEESMEKLESFCVETEQKLSKNYAVLAIFLSIKPQLIANYKKYINGCKGAEKGALGGAPHGNKNAQKTTPKQPPMKMNNVNVECRMKMNNVNENVNENDNVTSIVPIEVKEKKETNNNSVIISKEKKVSNNFISPSLEAIKEYIEENKYPLNAEDFYDFYSSKGWMVGKNKMKDWKAAVRMWSRRDRDTGGNRNRNVLNTPSPYVYNGLA